MCIAGQIDNIGNIVQRKRKKKNHQTYFGPMSEKATSNFKSCKIKIKK